MLQLFRPVDACSCHKAHPAYSRGPNLRLTSGKERIGNVRECPRLGSGGMTKPPASGREQGSGRKCCCMVWRKDKGSCLPESPTSS